MEFSELSRRSCSWYTDELIRNIIVRENAGKSITLIFNICYNILGTCVEWKYHVPYIVLVRILLSYLCRLMSTIAAEGMLATKQAISDCVFPIEITRAGR